MSPSRGSVRLVGETSSEVAVVGGVERTGRDEWRIVDELYPSLRRFAAVTAPWDMEPDDLLQEALVKVLGRHALSELNHPGAYIRKTMVNLAASHNRRMGFRRRALSRLTVAACPSSQPGYTADLADLPSRTAQRIGDLDLAQPRSLEPAIRRRRSLCRCLHPSGRDIRCRSDHRR